MHNAFCYAMHIGDWTNSRTSKRWISKITQFGFGNDFPGERRAERVMKGHRSKTRIVEDYE
jgi:hypothetical protein